MFIKSSVTIHAFLGSFVANFAKIYFFLQNEKKMHRNPYNRSRIAESINLIIYICPKMKVWWDFYNWRSSVKIFANVLALSILLALLAACGDESSSSVSPEPRQCEEQSDDCDDVSSSSEKISKNSSQKSADKGKSSSSEKNAKESSSSATTKNSSSSVSGDKSSSSAKKEGSSSSVVKASSSSATPKSSSSEEVKQSSSSVVASSSSVTSSETVKSSSSLSSSSEYVPFDHSKAFDGPLWRAGAYKTFVDARNGREYYYLEMDANGKSLKVMAENLNIGEMVWGFKDQKDDSKIERYCYDDDTTKCDRYGALYQWAEMMQLPSECNTKSCADQIKPNHQGICPDGWRLLTYDDFKFIINSNGNTHGVEGTRSTFGFGGYNTTGFSLVGAGSNWDYNFTSLNSATYWHYPEESSQYTNEGSFYSSQGTNSTKNPRLETMKTHGFSVRCVMVE